MLSREGGERALWKMGVQMTVWRWRKRKARAWVFWERRVDGWRGSDELDEINRPFSLMGLGL